MSKADELLDSLTDDEIAVYTATPDEEPHIVVGEDRYITVPDELKRIAVQGDHNIETVTFDCPRYWDEHDMSQMVIYIVYKRSDGVTDKYKADNVRINETDDRLMHFDWTLTSAATAASGSISIQICVKKTDGNGQLQTHWSSETNSQCTVSARIDCDTDALEEKYSDIITQLVQEMDELRELYNDEYSFTYNGNPITAKEYVKENGTSAEYYIKVSDTVLTMSDIIGAKLSINKGDSIETITVSESNIFNAEGYFAVEYNDWVYVYVVTADSVGWGDITLTTGVWFDDRSHITDDLVDDKSYTMTLIKTDSANVNIDSTLTVDGAAADAKATGDRLTAVEATLADMLYEAIAITSFTNNVGIVEMGSTVNDISLNWTLNKTPVSLTLDGVETDVNTTGTQLANVSLTSNKTWTLKATDDRNNVATKTTSVRFLNGVYYGATTIPAEYDSGFILELTRELLDSRSKNITVTAEESEYIFYCVPSRFGTCSFNVGGFDGGFDLIATIDFTNASGYTEEYYIYKSTNANLGTTTVKIT